MLKLLLNFWLSPLLLTFAAGAPAVGGGGGEGAPAGGGDSGGGTTVAEPTVTWGEPRYEEGTTEGADTGNVEDDSEAGAGDEGEVFEGFEGDDIASDTAKSPKEVLEGLRSQDPAVAKQAEKQVKRWFFENQRYKETGLESPEEARELVDKIEGWGGVEGIERETAEGATFWTMLDAGDPGLMASLEKDHAEGLLKLIPAAIDRYAELDSKGYAHKMANVFMATLSEAPAGGISALAAFNALAKIPGVKESEDFKRIAEVINAVHDISKQAPAKPTNDPKLTERERKVQEQEQNMKTQALAGKATPVLSKYANSAGAQAFKGIKLTEAGKKEVINRIHAEFAKLAGKETDRKKARQALLASGETEKWLKMVDADAKRIMPMAARMAKRWYDGISGASKKQSQERRAEGETRREAGGGGASGGTVRTAVPKNEVIDWGRMRAECVKQGFKDHEDMWLARRYFKKGDPKTTYSF